MAKAIRFYETGGPEVLKLETVEVGDPGPGQARVRHTYIAVNFIDIYHRGGLYPLPMPSGLGSEAAGTVAAVGACARRAGRVRCELVKKLVRQSRRNPLS